MHTSIEAEVKRCADAVWAMSAVLERHKELLKSSGSSGFTLSLELSEVSDPASSASD
jgi:hypothetical protein